MLGSRYCWARRTAFPCFLQLLTQPAGLRASLQHRVAIWPLACDEEAFSVAGDQCVAAVGLLHVFVSIV